MAYVGAFFLLVVLASFLKSRRLADPDAGGWLGAARRVSLTVSSDDRLQALVKRHGIHIDAGRREQGGRQVFNTVLRMKAPLNAAGLTICGESRWTRVQKLVRGEDVLLHDDDFDRRVHVQGDVAMIVSLFNGSLRAALIDFVERDGGEVGGGELCAELPGVTKDAQRLIDLVESLLSVRQAMTIHPRELDERLARNAEDEPLPAVRLRNFNLLVTRDGKGPLSRTTARRLLQDSDARVRLTAARLLLDADAFQVLAELLKSRNQPTLQAEALELLLEYWSYGQCKPLIEVALRSGLPALGLPALEGVVRARDHLRLDLVAQCAGQDDPKLAAKAAFALGELGDASREQVLVPLLERESDEVKLAAVKALGRIGTVASVEPLLSLTSGLLLSGGVKEAAREAVRRIQARAGPVDGGRLSLVEEHGSSGGLSLALDGGELSVEEEARPGNPLRQRE